MSFGKIIGDVVGTVVKPVTDLVKNNQDHKAAHRAAVDKIRAATVEGAQNLELTDAEAEALRWENEQDGWKDEYVTIVITAPIALIIIGAVAAAFGHPEVLTGATTALKELKNVDIDLGFLMEAVVLAAVGLKVWRKLVG